LLFGEYLLPSENKIPRQLLDFINITAGLAGFLEKKLKNRIFNHEKPLVVD
jgi:hypothetical protein